ncbi:hypothetical protein BY458DRAFT_551770 [Sporodiniella umbellata]|nr:hypothetical protein BY458DRAFT_551770 [Sporodiniella umbellata]
MITTLTSKYLEFRKAANKTNVEEAILQHKSLDWKFEGLKELYIIVQKVKHESVEKASANIRGAVRLLGNETFLSEHRYEIIEVLKLFKDFEYQKEKSDVTSYLIEGFIYLGTRCTLATYLVEGNGLMRESVIEKLLLCAQQLSSRSPLQLSEMMYTLADSACEYAHLIRLRLLEMQILPDAIIKITAIHCNDEVELLNGFFHRSPSWFLAQDVSSRMHFLTIKNRIVAEIKTPSRNENPVTLASPIRALIGIVGYFGIKLSEREVEMFIAMLGTTRNERIAQLLLCLVLLSADQFLKKQKKLVDTLYESLKCEVSEMSLLILVYFQTDKIPLIEEIIRSTLCMQIPILFDNITRSVKGFLEVKMFARFDRYEFLEKCTTVAFGLEVAMVFCV